MVSAAARLECFDVGFKRGLGLHLNKDMIAMASFSVCKWSYEYFFSLSSTVG